MSYTKALFFKDGKVLTITEEEANGIKAGLLAGGKWVHVQEDLISADNIARVGNHEMSAELKRVEYADLDRKLVLSGRSDLVDAKRSLAKKMSVKME